MDLEETLKTVIPRLQSGNLHGEAQVKQSAILPILRALDWDDADPEVLKPEYRVSQDQWEGQVDYALFDHRKALVFIEAKGIGALDTKGREQLFRYASNKGVSASYFDRR